jgi:hypothetical protein
MEEVPGAVLPKTELAARVLVGAAVGASASLVPDTAWVGVGVYPWQLARNKANRSKIERCLGIESPLVGNNCYLDVVEPSMNLPRIPLGG